jgi:hypothetical protein
MNIFELDQSLRKKKSADPNGGISKEKETEFHADLDTLVHNTFGKRKDEEKQRLDPKCWTGYRKAGTKMKGGVRVNNCVKVEDQGAAEGSEDSDIKLLQSGKKTSDGIGMQDIRLMAGEGKLTKKTVLQALTVIRKQRRELENSKQGVAESQTAKAGIVQTEVYGTRAYHAKCMEPNCDWQSKRYDRINQAQAVAKKHSEQHFNKKDVAEGSSDTIYPNAEVIKSKNGKPVGEIYQDGNSWGAFHYRADRGYDFIDSREDAIEALKDLHQETGRSRPDYTIKGVTEAINPDITNPEFSHQQQIGDYLYVARYWSKGLKITAYHGNKQIGYAELMYQSAPFDDFADPKTTPKRIWLESEWTRVDPKYQRQGIMSTMYAYAKMLGNSVKPSQTRSDDAKAAWKSWRQSGDAQHLTREGVAEGFKNTYSVGDRVESPMGTGTIVSVSKNVNVDGNVEVKLDDPSRAGEDGKYKDTFVLTTTMLKHLPEDQGVAEDAEPMDREWALVKKLGRLGERVVQNPKLWDRYNQAIDNEDIDWIIGLIQDGTGATASEVTKLADLFGEIGGGLGRLTDFAWAVKEGHWDEDFMNPYRAHRSQGLNEFSFDKDGGDDGGEDPYKYPQPEHYNRSIDFFGRFEADHFDDEEFDKATGVFKGYWDDAEGRDQIAYFKFDNPRRTGDDDPGMGWYYEPQNEGVDEGWKQNLAALGLAGLTALAPTPAAAAPAQTSTVSTVAHGTTGDQIVNHKNYKKYYDQALAGRNTARAHQTAQQIATLKVKADIAKGIKEQGPASSKEADYGPEYQDMVKRVGQRAKQGPLKTVWDPVKRVYKNVPVNKDQGVDEASLATMRDYFAGNLDAQDPTKLSQMRKFFAKQNVPAKEKTVKKFHNQDEYQQWVSKVKPMATNNVREAGPYSRGYYNPADDERREQEYGDRSNRDWKHRERAEEESSVLYRFDPSDGKLKQRMWSHAKFGQARSEGYKDTPDQAMKALGYFPSKFKPGHYVKKGLDGKWETVFPYANKSVNEAAGTISLDMNDGSTKMLRSGAPALNSVKSALSYLVRSKDFETLKNLKAIDGQDVTGIVSKIFKPSNTISLGEALDTEFQNFLKQAKHRYPDSKDENEAFMRFVHDELEKEGRIDRGQSQDIDHLEAKIDSLIVDLSKMNKSSASEL